MHSLTNLFKTFFLLIITFLLYCSQSNENKENFQISNMYQNDNSYNIIQETYNKELVNFPILAKDTFIDGKFGKTHVLEWGNHDNDTLILIHGLSGNSMQWGKEFISSISKSFYIISLETIGDNVGKSIPNYWPIERDSLKIWLNETIEMLNLKQVNLVGLAMGGWLIQDYAINYPQNVKSLSVIGAAGSGDPKYINLIKILYNVRKKNIEGYKKAYSYLRAKDAKINDNEIQYFKTVFENCKPINHIPRKFKVEELKKINAPITIFLGLDDCYFNTKKAQKWRSKHSPQNKIVILGNAGHLMHLDKPYDIINNIKDFVNNCNN